MTKEKLEQLSTYLLISRGIDTTIAVDPVLSCAGLWVLLAPGHGILHYWDYMSYSDMRIETTLSASGTQGVLDLSRYADLPLASVDICQCPQVRNISTLCDIPTLREVSCYFCDNVTYSDILQLAYCNPTISLIKSDYGDFFRRGGGGGTQQWVVWTGIPECPYFLLDLDFFNKNSQLFK